MGQDYLQELALLMAVNCVRNTVIEDYHGREGPGSLSDADMMAFNKEVVNKLYTFLVCLFGDEREAFLKGVGLWHPHNWDAPQFDESFAESSIALGRDFGERGFSPKDDAPG